MRQLNGNYTGTITWISIKKHLPSGDDKSDLGNYSPKVLVTNGVDIATSQVVYTVNGSHVGWLGKNLFGFEPTHWAFINLPE